MLLPSENDERDQPENKLRPQSSQERTASKNAERCGLGNGTSRVTKCQAKRGTSCDVDEPGHGSTRLLPKVLKGTRRRLATRENAGIIFERTRKIKKYLKHTSEQFKEDTEEIRVEKLGG